jgi:spore germination protein GerM
MTSGIDDMNLNQRRDFLIIKWVSRVAVAWLTISGLAIGSGCLAGAGEQQPVHLYFADAAKPFLVGETRFMVPSRDAQTFGRQVVTELINGPADENLATLPEGTRLRTFFVLGDGTAVVDFSAHLRDEPPGSCRQEQLTLFSVVNSLVLNVPGIDRVKILVEGAETTTLSGHLPLEHPLTADLLLTR